MSNKGKVIYNGSEIGGSIFCVRCICVLSHNHPQAEACAYLRFMISSKENLEHPYPFLTFFKLYIIYTLLNVIK